MTKAQGMKNVKQKLSAAEKRARAAQYARTYYLRKKAKKEAKKGMVPFVKPTTTFAPTSSDLVKKVLALPGTPSQKIQILEILLK